MDSLLSRSIVVPEFYAHGTFTSLAQVSILCSIYDPVSAIDGKSSIMRAYPELDLKCLPHFLKQKGYQNYFFNGYRMGFDNKKIFMPKMGIDKLIGREKIKQDFSIRKDEHTWGMEDKTVLKDMLQTLNKEKNPFFSFFMSVNTHLPYDHLKGIEKVDLPHNSSLLKTDTAIAEFMEQAKKEKWYNNTIFVFLADNGTSFGQLREKRRIDKDKYYNRIPFAIYSPKLDAKKLKYRKIGSQVDITPTLMQMIGFENVDNHFVGKSLFDLESKPFIFQYKYPNNFFTISRNSDLKRLRDLYIYLVVKNKFFGEEKVLLGHMSN